MTTSNHVHELANQANELTEDELNHVSGGIEWTYRREPTYHPAKVTVPDLKLS